MFVGVNLSMPNKSKARKLGNAHGMLVNATPVPQASSKNNVANLGTNIATMKGGKINTKKTGLIPAVSVESRSPPFLQMLMDPVGADPALPPISIPARCIPLKQYTEVLLSTDASGNCGLNVTPLMGNHYVTYSTWTGTSPATYSAGQTSAEYTNFTQNFQYQIPMCIEVCLRYTGSMTNVSGRMYGIVGNGGVTDVTKFPLEPNGCEAVTSDGISCTWYSTSPVWNNPTAATQIAGYPTEWMDPQICCAMVGGPVSATNVVSVGIWFHLVGVPKSGICGLTPMAALPDPSLEMIASLLSSATTGLGASAASLKERAKHKKRKAVLKDVIKIGGRVVGTVFPSAGIAMNVADALANMLG